MSSRWWMAGLASLLLTSLALANKAPFPPQPVAPVATPAKLVVQVDPTARVPLLKIPAALVAPAEAPRRGGQALLDNPMTLLAGLALAAAFVSGGFWLMRGKSSRTATTVLGVLALALIGGSLFADLAPFPGPRPRPNPLPLPPVPGGVIPVQLPAAINLTSDITVQVYAHPVDQNFYLVLPLERPGVEPGPGAAPLPGVPGIPPAPGLPPLPGLITPPSVGAPPTPGSAPNPTSPRPE